MNEQMLEYLRLKTVLENLYSRQGEESWEIIQKCIKDLTHHEQVSYNNNKSQILK
jgi:hypothetical protein